MRRDRKRRRKERIYCIGKLQEGWRSWGRERGRGRMAEWGEGWRSSGRDGGVRRKMGELGEGWRSWERAGGVRGRDGGVKKESKEMSESELLQFTVTIF